MLKELLSKLPKRGVQRAKQRATVRLAPAVMATAAALLSVKAVAMAQQVAEAPVGESHIETPAPAEGGASPAAPADGAAAAACPTPSFAEQAGLSQAEVQVLQALAERRAQLDQRASSMDTEGQLMTAAEQRLDQRLTELRQLETTVSRLLGQLDQAQEQRLASLVDVYQRMRAKDAATVFDGLSDDVLVQVASRMRQQNLAEVMGRMNPSRARALTQMLADQARPPTSGESLLQRAQGAPAARTPASAQGAAAPAAAPAAGR